MKVAGTLKRLAQEKGISPSQLAISWVLAKEESLVPVMGARTRIQLSESLAALNVKLSPTEVAYIEKEIPESSVAGARYDEHQMSMLDSER
jgi:aryl-alcohol dehydrogenase-like predicted oxidoreductase